MVFCGFIRVDCFVGLEVFLGETFLVGLDGYFMLDFTL